MNLDKYVEKEGELWDKKRGQLYYVDIAEMVYLETLQEILEDNKLTKVINLEKYIQMKKEEWTQGRK